MADIFISYARTDRDRVRPLADALSAHGWSVWWDRQIPAGRTFDQVIAEALGNARCVVVVWSTASVASNWVREEAEEGRRREILIPILIDDARPPLGFGRIQAADLSGWNGDSAADAFVKLLADITSVVGPPISPDVQASPSAISPKSTDLRPTASAVIEHPRVQPAARPPRDPFDWLRSARVRWSLVAAVAIALIVLALVIGTKGGENSQPPPTVGSSPETALRLTAVLTEGGQPLQDGVSYEVFEPTTDAEGTRKRVGGSPAYAGPPRFPLPVGRYYVTAQYGSATAATEVEIAAGTMVIQPLNLRAGILRLSSVLVAGGQPLASDVAYDVFEAAKDVEGNRKRVVGSPAYAGPPRLPLPAGRYFVTATYRSASQSTEVEVTPGEIKLLPIDLKAGVLSVSAVLGAGSEPLASGVAYAVYEAAKDVEGNRKRIVGSPAYDGPPRLPLPAGRYVVTADYGSASASVETDVAAGELKRQILNLRAGILALSSLANGAEPIAKGVAYDVFDAAKDADGKRKRVTGSPAYEGPPRLPLPVGRYYVTATSDAGRGDTEVVIAEGEIQQAQLRLSRPANR